MYNIATLETKALIKRIVAMRWYRKE